MNLERVAEIARAVLYEGYMLYPYRPSALKNQQRWTFGAIFPRAYAEQAKTDPWSMQTQCLLCAGPAARLSARIRFLHLSRREMREIGEDAASLAARGDFEAVAGAPSPAEGCFLAPWDEAIEREIVAPTISLSQLTDKPSDIPFRIAGAHSDEAMRGEDGRIVGALARTAGALEGVIKIAAEPVSEDAHLITVRIENASRLPQAARLSRDAAQAWAFASTHTILGVENGAFVSLADPPDRLRRAAAACDNQGTWPALVGDEGSADTVLSSPIILPDYPQIAPESPGDLFDGCEIDEILILRILTMTDEEKREMAAAAPRARELLARTEALAPADIERLHGALRRPGGAIGPPGARSPAVVQGQRISPGDRVVLRPKGRADIMDVVLNGMVAIVESVERDFEGRVYIAVTLVDDPGRDLGVALYPGHRFFFSVDEVEPAEQGASA